MKPFEQRFDLGVCYALMWGLAALLFFGGSPEAAAFWLVGIMVGRKIEQLDPTQEDKDERE